MPEASREAPPGRERMLTFASGGWVLLLAGLISIGLVAFWVVPFLMKPRARPVGDGRTVESYAFDLSDLRVTRPELVASGLPRDGLPALDDPRAISPEEADAITREERGKYLVPNDRVVGVEIDGAARAYPVRLLTWHEVVNDTLAGRPILVTYSPLGDASVVFDRRVAAGGDGAGDAAGDAAGEVLSFGVSGLLWNSNTLVYDRPDVRRDGVKGPSLWAPLVFGAVAGPRSGTALTPVPHRLTTWGTWRARYPKTTVLWPDPRWKKRYKEEPYNSYYGSGDLLRFPVRPLPGDGRALKTPVIVPQGGADAVFLPEIIAGRAPGYTPDPGGETAFAEKPALAHAFWFAWYAASNNTSEAAPRVAGVHDR